MPRRERAAVLRGLSFGPTKVCSLSIILYIYLNLNDMQMTHGFEIRTVICSATAAYADETSVSDSLSSPQLFLQHAFDSLCPLSSVRQSPPLLSCLGCWELRAGTKPAGQLLLLLLLRGRANSRCARSFISADVLSSPPSLPLCSFIPASVAASA